MKICFLKFTSHLGKAYVSVEELVRNLSHNKSGLFQPLSTKEIFSRGGKITTFTNLSLLPHLGS
jgi:hypothetical protein